MTVTDTRPETNADSAPQEAQDPYSSTGFAGALATGDHKVIGRMYVLFGLAGGVLALVLNVLTSLERLSLDNFDDVLSWGTDNTFFQVWSLGRTSILFFCVVPLLLGLATYIVPLQVGAPSIAFPRAAAAGFWAWLIGMGIHVTTVAIDGGLGYPLNPVAAAQGTDPEAVELSLLSIGLVVLAILLASVTIMTTVITQRPEGMSLWDAPMFSWSMLVAGGMWLLTLPVWLANLAIVWVDFRGEDALRYGRVENIWAQLDWLWSQPAIFAFAIPLLGIVSEIVPVGARTRQRYYSVQQGAVGGFGLLTFGAWAQPAFNDQVTEQVLYVAMGLVLIIPVLVFLGGLIDTIVQGKPVIHAHFAIGLLSVVVLLAGAAAAAVRVLGPGLGVLREFDDSWLKQLIEPLEDLQGTVISTGVMTLAMGAALLGAVAGLYYWAPKIFGRQLMGGIGALAGLAIAGGAVISGVANIVNGFLNEGEFVFIPEANVGIWDTSSVETFNAVGLVGAIMMLGGLLLVCVDLLVSVGLGRGEAEDADDPWNGHTLEWATASPPPVGNFETAPVVHSERPLLDLLEEDA